MVCAVAIVDLGGSYESARDGMLGEECDEGIRRGWKRDEHGEAEKK